MIKHDEYGKRLVRGAAGEDNVKGGYASRIDLGGAGFAHIDCTVHDEIAVEVESRTSKQVRGAVLDLLCHSCPKKLLVLLPVHMNAINTKKQCDFLFLRWLSPEKFRVVACEGTVGSPHEEADMQKIRQALSELRFATKA
jgi:hypothetical protein